MYGAYSSSVLLDCSLLRVKGLSARVKGVQRSPLLAPLSQEYESYYQVKFRRQPKLVKRIAAEGIPN